MGVIHPPTYPTLTPSPPHTQLTLPPHGPKPTQPTPALVQLVWNLAGGCVCLTLSPTHSHPSSAHTAQPYSTPNPPCSYFGIMLEDVCVTSNGRQYIDRQSRMIGYDDTPQVGILPARDC